MAVLHNRISRNELRQRLMNEPFKRTTLSFYRYVIIDDAQAMRDQLYLAFSKLQVFGRIYVAREGINAQISLPEDNLQAFRELLDSDPHFKDVPFKIAVEDDGKSFFMLIIKVRPKIVADGLNDDAFDVTNVGTHLTAEEFNAAMELPGTIVVDMRNHYESEVGHFENAMLPQADTFKDELPMVVEQLKEQKDKKILMYCTGGIRCEKASAYLKHHGFNDVSQLYGGIIEYARQVKNNGLESKFIGKNFVFDERLGERITNDIIARCHQCGEPADTHVNCANVECHTLFIQCAACAEKMRGCCTEKCMEWLDLSPEERHARRDEMPRFEHKSRLRPKLPFVKKADPDKA